MLRLYLWLLADLGFVGRTLSHCNILLGTLWSWWIRIAQCSLLRSLGSCGLGVRIIRLTSATSAHFLVYPLHHALESAWFFPTILSLFLILLRVKCLIKIDKSGTWHNLRHMIGLI